MFGLFRQTQAFRKSNTPRSLPWKRPLKLISSPQNGSFGGTWTLGVAAPTGTKPMGFVRSRIDAHGSMLEPGSGFARSNKMRLSVWEKNKRRQMYRSGESAGQICERTSFGVKVGFRHIGNVHLVSCKDTVTNHGGVGFYFWHSQSTQLNPVPSSLKLSRGSRPFCSRLRSLLVLREGKDPPTIPCKFPEYL